MNDRRREPSLAQVLDDPMTQVLMMSDGVDPRALRDLIEEARQRMADSESESERLSGTRRR
jgi:hypothetical protein